MVDYAIIIEENLKNGSHRKCAAVAHVGDANSQDFIHKKASYAHTTHGQACACASMMQTHYIFPYQKVLNAAKRSFVFKKTLIILI